MIAPTPTNPSQFPDDHNINLLFILNIREPCPLHLSCHKQNTSTCSLSSSITYILHHKVHPNEQIRPHVKMQATPTHFRISSYTFMCNIGKCYQHKYSSKLAPIIIDCTIQLCSSTIKSIKSSKLKKINVKKYTCLPSNKNLTTCDNSNSTTIS